MIKVFHIITGGLQREGISSTQLEFFKNLSMDEFKIYIAAVHNNSEDMIRDYENIGCTVFVFPDRKKKTIKYFISLVNKLKCIKPDIVHVHGSSAIMCIELLAAKIAGVKIRIAHSRNTKADNAKIDKVLRPVFNQLYTDALACGIEAGKWLFGNRDFKVIHNGKDFDKFKYDLNIRNNLRESYNLENKIVLGHVGVFNYQKNHEYIIKVFESFQKRYDNAVLYFMGTGPLIETCKRQVKEMKIDNKVIFAGSVNNVADRLQAMDIMLFPSRFEGLPNVVLEWQAEGLPCLISDTITKECAPSNLVKFASIKEKPEYWAEKIEEMLDEFTDRKMQAKNGTKALQKSGFDIKDAVEQQKKVYLELVKKYN